MFVVLTLAPAQPRSFFAGFLDKLKPRPPTAALKSAYGCRYLHIHQPMTPAGANWKMITTLSGKWAGRLVLPEDCQLPQGYGLSRIVPEEYLERLLVNTACQAVQASRTELYERNVVLIDPSGRRQWAALALLQYCTALTVVTESPARYQVFCSQAMEHYGAPVALAQDTSQLHGPLFAVAPAQSPPPPCPCPVFTNAGASGDSWINSLALAPERLCGQLPTGVPALPFAAALWQLGRVAKVGGFWADSCRIGGRLQSFDELAAFLYGRAVQLRMR